jgi:hypothetical protein
MNSDSVPVTVVATILAEPPPITLWKRLDGLGQQERPWAL